MQIITKEKNEMKINNIFFQNITGVSLDNIKSRAHRPLETSEYVNKCPPLRPLNGFNLG